MEKETMTSAAEEGKTKPTEAPQALSETPSQTSKEATAYPASAVDKNYAGETYFLPAVQPPASDNPLYQRIEDLVRKYNELMRSGDESDMAAMIAMPDLVNLPDGVQSEFDAALEKQRPHVPEDELGNVTSRKDYSVPAKYWRRRFGTALMVAAGLGLGGFAMVADKYLPSFDDVQRGKAVKRQAMGEIERIIKKSKEGKEVWKYNYDVDNILVSSNTVEEGAFVSAYVRAKFVLGTPHWKPASLRVEFKSNGTNSGSAAAAEAAADRQKSFDEIKTLPRDLPRELVRILLGPAVYKKWPHLLEEFVAAAADDFDAGFKIEDLNGSWLQMAADIPERQEPNLAMVRSEIFRNLLAKQRKRNPFVLKNIISVALQEDKDGRLRFDDGSLANFFEGFGIKHPIFQPGKPGDQVGIVEQVKDGRQGLFVIRVANSKENDQNVLSQKVWRGSVAIIPKDQTGSSYPPLLLNLDGGGFVPYENFKPRGQMRQVTVQFEDGRVEEKKY